MSWTDIFRSRYVRMLEETIDRLRKDHAEEAERIKTLHAGELERAITEGNRGWAEADRLRQYLIPGLPASTRVVDDTPPPTVDDVETGTPWQRIQKRAAKELALQTAEREAAKKAQVFPTPTEAPASPASKEN